MQRKLAGRQGRVSQGVGPTRLLVLTLMRVVRHQHVLNKAMRGRGMQGRHTSRLYFSSCDPLDLRESSVRMATSFVEHVPDLTPYLAYLFPVLMAQAVPRGSLYDPDIQLFVFDISAHEAYKR